jgi:CHAT domain-containing protein
MCQFNRLSRMVKRGNFEKALAFANKKMTNINERNVNSIKLKRFYLTLGKIHYILGDYTQAEKEYNAALTIVNNKFKSGKRLTLPDFDVLDEFAMFNVNTGNFLQAREYIDRSLKLRVHKFDKRNPANFRPYLPLGMLFLYKEQYDSAKYFLNIYQKQIRNSNYTGFLDINRYADTYQVLAEIEIKTHALRSAKRHAKKSARLQHHLWTKRESGKNFLNRIKAFNTLSTINRLQGKYKRASGFNKKAQTLYNKKYTNQNYALAPVCIEAAWLSLNRNDIPGVKQQLKKVMALQLYFVRNNFSYLSEYEKENYYARLRESFNDMNCIVLKMYLEKKITENDSIVSSMLNFTLNTKAVILSETNRIIENIRTSKDQDLQGLLKRWQNLKNEWAFLSGNTKKKNKEKLASLQNEIIAIEKEMALRALQLNERKNTDWHEVKNKLVANEAAIELVRISTAQLFKDTTTMYMGYVIKHDKEFPSIVVYNNGNQLENRYVKYYFNSVFHNIPDTISYTVFWKPLELLLLNIKSVYMSPDGVFNLVNFGSMKESINDSYLLDKLKITYVTNCANILSKRSDTFTFTSAGMFGAPDFSLYSATDREQVGFSGAIPSLPGTEQEVKEISKLLKNNNINTTVCVKEKASEYDLQHLANVNVLHLATHGFFAGTSSINDPMLGSGLILSKARDTNTDGILTAYEASTLNLENTNLVVLSACKTALGEVREGEGVYGLQRAFEVAGVNNIIMTLWSVDDIVTKEFMTDFYGKLLAEKNVALAFQHALLKLKQKHADPYYWAPFKLIRTF